MLQAIDALRLSRKQSGTFNYRLERNCEVIFSAGGVVDEGGLVTLWQEYDSEPNPNAEQTILGCPVAERIKMTRPYLSVRVNDQFFHLLAGQDVYVDPHYVFWLDRTTAARAHCLTGTPADYAAGRIGELRKELTKELIKNAAHQLTASKTRIV